MAHVDMECVNALWQRVSDVFQRKADMPEVPSKYDYIASAGIEVSGTTFTITFYDGNGLQKDYVQFTIN